MLDWTLNSKGSREEILAYRSIQLAYLAVDSGRKITPGITESSQVRAHIDPVACFLDVVFSHRGPATGAKRGAVRPLKRNMRWVQTLEREVGFYLLDLYVN